MTRLRALSTAAAAALVMSACTEGPGPMESTGRVAPLDIVPSFQVDPSFFAYDPIDRIRAVARDVGTSATVGSLDRSVDPNASEWLLDIGIDLGEASSLTVEVDVELLSDGVVQWSGRVGPITVPSPAAAQAIDLHRGPLDNLEVRALDVPGHPTQIGVGSSLGLSAEVTLAPGSTANPIVYWASSNPAAATVTGEGPTATLTGVAPGSAEIVAVAGEAVFEFTVQVVTASPVGRSWIGGDGTDPDGWANPDNWSPAGVPDADDDVLIAGSGYDPVLSGPVTVASIVVGSPRAVDLNSFTLTVAGDVDATQGLFVGGAVRVDGTGSVLEGTFDDLVLAGTQRAISGNTFAYGSLSLLDARLDVGPFVVSVDLDLVVDGPAGVLAMTDPGANVTVFGDATFNGGDHEGLLTAGSLSVYGQLHATDASPTSFAASGEHLTYLFGGVAQSVVFEIPGPGAQRLNDVTITNGAGVTFQTDAYAARDVEVYGNMIVPGGTTTTVAGEVYLAFSSRLEVDGVLAVGGECIDDGALILGSGQQPCGTPAQADRTWQGGDGNAPSDWSNPNNWSPAGVPTPTESVLVPDGVSFNPVMTSDATIDGLIVEGTLDQGGFKLTVTGSVAMSGSVENGSTELAPGVGTPTVHGSFDLVVVSGARALDGLFQAFGDVDVQAPFDIGANQALIYANFGVKGPNASLIMQDQGGQLSIQGDALFDGVTSIGKLTAGLVQVIGDFTALSTHSPTSFQAEGTLVYLTPIELDQTVTFDNPGPTGQSFGDLFVTGEPVATVFATDALVTGLLSAGSAILAQGGAATLEVRGTLALGQVTLEGLPLRLVSDVAPDQHSATGVTFTNFLETDTQLYLELPGAGPNFPFQLIAPVFGPEPAPGYYIEARNATPPTPILVIEVLSPTPQTTNAYSTDGETQLFWNP